MIGIASSGFFLKMRVMSI